MGGAHGVVAFSSHLGLRASDRGARARNPIWGAGRGLAGRRPTPGVASPAREMRGWRKTCARELRADRERELEAGGLN